MRHISRGRRLRLDSDAGEIFVRLKRMSLYGKESFSHCRDEHRINIKQSFHLETQYIKTLVKFYRPVVME